MGAKLALGIEQYEPGQSEARGRAIRGRSAFTPEKTGEEERPQRNRAAGKSREAGGELAK